MCVLVNKRLLEFHVGEQRAGAGVIRTWYHRERQSSGTPASKNKLLLGYTKHRYLRGCGGGPMELGEVRLRIC